MTPPTKLKPVAHNATTDNVNVVKPGTLEWGLVIAGFQDQRSTQLLPLCGKKDLQPTEGATVRRHQAYHRRKFRGSQGATA